MKNLFPGLCYNYCHPCRTNFFFFFWFEEEKELKVTKEIERRTYRGISCPHGHRMRNLKPTNNVSRYENEKPS